MQKRRKSESLPPETLCQIAQEHGPEGELAFGELLATIEHRLDILVERFRARGMGPADLRQEALFALRYKAIPVFKPEETTFERWAMFVIRRHLCTIYKNTTRNQHRALNQSVGFGSIAPRSQEGKDRDFGDSFIDHKAENPLDLLAQSETASQLLSRILERLTPIELQVITGLQRHGSYAAVAQVLDRPAPTHFESRC